ncbi:hypothetical protein KIPB_001939, partial [Kipferlia bialata]
SILSGTAASASASASASAPGTVDEALDALTKGIYSPMGFQNNVPSPDDYTVQLCRDPVLLGHVMALLDPSTHTPQTVEATLTLLYTIAARNPDAGQYLVQAGLFPRLTGLVSGADAHVSTALRIIVTVLGQHLSLALPVLHTPLFKAVLAANPTHHRFSICRVVKIVVYGLLSKGERDTQGEVSEADYHAIKTVLPTLGVISHLGHGGFDAIATLLSYSEISCGEHSGLQDIADAGLIPTLLRARERHPGLMDTETAASLDRLKTRLKANPDLHQYLPKGGMVIERTQVPVARPFHTYDCVKTGANTCMLLGFRGAWPTADHVPEASTVTVVHDEADDSAPPRLESSTLDVPYRGVACGVCMGGKVYVYASGRPAKCCDDELSDLDEAEQTGDASEYREEHRWETMPEPEGLASPALHVYSMATGKWTDRIELEGDSPSVRYPRGMVSVSDTEFLLVAGKFTVSQWKPLQAWIYNTETGTWRRVANPPLPPSPDDTPHDDYYRHTLYGMGVQGGTVHLLGMAGDETDTYHASYTMPTSENTQGTWTDLSTDGLKGSCYQPMGDGLALAVCDYSIAAYDSCSGTVGPVLDDLPATEDGLGSHYASCEVGGCVLLTMSWHRELGGSIDTSEVPEGSVDTCYLLEVDADELRQCC